MSEGFKQTQTERCVVYCVSDIRVIHMAPSAGSLCFPPSADFHPCSARGAGDTDQPGIIPMGTPGTSQELSLGHCCLQGTRGGSGGERVWQPGGSLSAGGTSC